MKIIAVLIIVCLSLIALAQPHANGNGNGNGNGNHGNGNNGNGNGGCPNPPCGGPNSVPIDVEWLVVAGLAVGCYIKFLKSRSRA